MRDLVAEAFFFLQNVKNLWGSSTSDAKVCRKTEFTASVSGARKHDDKIRKTILKASTRRERAAGSKELVYDNILGGGICACENILIRRPE